MARGAHAAPPQKSPARVIGAGALTVALAGGLLLWSPWSDADPGTNSATGGSGSSSTTRSSQSESPGAVNCPAPVALWAGAAQDSLLAPLATAFTASVNPKCPMPQASQLTASSASQAGVVVAPATEPTDKAIATTQVVFGMPREMARALGWPDPLAPATVQDLLNLDLTFAELGRPEWGTFRIASPDPTKSLVGTVGFGALTTLANGGKFLTAAPNYANPTKADYAVVHSEQRIETVTKTDAESDAIMDVETVEEFVEKASAVITTERAVIAHNQRFPQNPFVAIPLLDGAASVPVVVTTSEDGGEDAGKLASFLATGAGSAALQQAGFRSVMGQEPSVGTAALAPTSTGPFPFTQEMVAGVHQIWSTMHARTSTLALIDLSGSMRYPFDKTGVTKINLVRQLATRAFRLASPRANSTAWFFHTAGSAPEILDQLPLQRNDIVKGGKAHSERLQDLMRQVQPGGGTPLYLAVRQAYAEATRKYADGYLNQVVVITDGNNEDALNPMTLAQLKSYVRGAYDKKKPVVISFFLIDAGVNRKPLEQVAALTGGVAATVTKMEDVPDAFAKALFSSPN